MLEAAGKPLLGHVIERLSYSTTLERVIVATSTHERDDAIADYCNMLSIPVFRGSENDVLDRYYRAALEYGIDTVVRITADCPLIDPTIVDEMVHFFCEHLDQYDLVTNRHPLSCPDGLDLDVMSISGLEYVWKHATEPHQREHTVPFFWESGMRVYNVDYPDQLFYQHRWTLDYPEDYELIKHLLTALNHEGQLFTTQDILDYLALHPELQQINAQYIPSR
jgi:spore coat polysaccharide biosynthesis protein SpsF